MIATDGVHVISTKDLKELHDFAKTIGMSHSFYHSGSRIPHYDIPKKLRGKYLPGAKVVPSARDVVRMARGVNTTVVEAEGEGEGGFTAGKRASRNYKCDFCGAPLDRFHQYLYPPPDPVDLFQGKRACQACAPAQMALQVEQGLVIPVQPTTVVRR